MLTKKQNHQLKAYRKPLGIIEWSHTAYVKIKAEHELI